MSLLLDRNRSVVVLIDLQARLLPAISGHQAVLNQALRLARLARLLEVPVIATEHCGDKLGPIEPGILEQADQQVSKICFDACRENGLFAAWPQGREQVVIAGTETHVCLFQTAIALIERGYHVTVMTDAIGSRRNSDRDIAIASLARAGARLGTVEQAGFEWLESADHPRFGEALALIKAP